MELKAIRKTNKQKLYYRLSVSRTNIIKKKII